jgi:hypothetical protein
MPHACAGNFLCFMINPLQYGINLLNGDAIGSKVISYDAYCNLIDWSVRLRNLHQLVSTIVITIRALSMKPKIAIDFDNFGRRSLLHTNY